MSNSVIDAALLLLKKRLDDHMSTQLGESPEERVVFLDHDKIDPVSFKLGAVTVLLINVESENVLRAADQRHHAYEDGRVTKTCPEIRLNLYVLFVSRFTEYEQSLKALSQIIQYFQLNPVLDRDMPEDIEKLILELVTLPFSEQNEIWNSLRTTYHPSALYRVKMLVYLDTRDEQVRKIEKAVVQLEQRA